MSERNTIASDAEIQAALAEAESRTSDIPSLDKGSTPAVVHVPVEAASTIPPKVYSRPPSEPVVVSSPAEPAAGAQPEDEAEADPQTKRHGVIARFAYNAVDRVLSAVNQPFNRCPAETRCIIGVAAVITIGLSLLAACLLPVIDPPRDPVSVLQHESRVVQMTLSNPTPAPQP